MNDRVLQVRVPSVRKAALLLATLDQHTARTLLAHLTEQDTQQVFREIAGLGAVASVEQQTVVEEFLRVRPLMLRSDPSGVELDAVVD